jgi:hypothetical protein
VWITKLVINKKLPGVETPRRNPENQQTGLFDIIKNNPHTHHCWCNWWLMYMDIWLEKILLEWMVNTLVYSTQLPVNMFQVPPYHTPHRYNLEDRQSHSRCGSTNTQEEQLW